MKAYLLVTFSCDIHKGCREWQTQLQCVHSSLSPSLAPSRSLRTVWLYSGVVLIFVIDRLCNNDRTMRSYHVAVFLLVSIVSCLATPPEEEVVEAAPATDVAPRAADAEAEDYYYYYDDKAAESEQLVIPAIDPQVVREVLRSKEKTRKMVNCVIYFEEGCPVELEKINKMAPEIFRRGGRCFRCAAEDQQKLREFLVELQRHQPSEYRRMIRELNKL